MEIYDLLREDHAAMLARLRKLAAQPRKREAIEALKSHFEFHDLFEREVLYPAIAAAPGGVGATERALGEHDQLGVLLETLGEPSAEAAAEDAAALDWRAQTASLGRALEAHITREEGPLFELAHGSISAADAADMAEKYHAARRMLLNR